MSSTYCLHFNNNIVLKSYILGSGLSKIQFRWFVLCSFGASRCYYLLGVVDSHLSGGGSGSICCDMALTWVKPSVTDFTQVWARRGSTPPHLRAALQLRNSNLERNTEHLSIEFHVPLSKQFAANNGHNGQRLLHLHMALAGILFVCLHASLASDSSNTI